MGPELQEVHSKPDQEYLVIILVSFQAKVFLPFGQALEAPASYCYCPAGRSMQVLGLMVSTFEAVLYAQFNTRGLQKEILSNWDTSPLSLDNRMSPLFVDNWLAQWAWASLVWCWSNALWHGSPFLGCSGQ